MTEAIGNRMKGFYENRTRYLLPRRTYTLIRIDGKAFHTYTKGLNRPFDSGLMEDMDETAKHLCKNIQGTKFIEIPSGADLNSYTSAGNYRTSNNAIA